LALHKTIIENTNTTIFQVTLALKALSIKSTWLQL